MRYRGTKMAIERSPDILEDYDLFQAYYLLGLRMYGDEWNGFNEILAKKDERSVESIEAKRNKIKKDKKDNQEEIIALERNIIRQTEPEKIQVLEGMLGSLWDKTRILDLEQDDLRVLTDIQEQQQKYKRRIAVENTLIKALKERKIEYWSVRGMPYDTRIWEKVDGCSFNIELSCIWWGKKTHSGTRRQFVRIRKGVFDLWLDKHYPIIDLDDKALSVNELAESWLIEQLKKQGQLNWRRDDYIDYMMSEISISKRHAHHLWKILAPDKMKKAGRPKSTRP